MATKIKEFRIVDLGCDEESYFQGHGVAFSSYTDSSVGMGDTAEEALEDAIDALEDATIDGVDLDVALRASQAWKDLASDPSTVLQRAGCACDELAECKGNPEISENPCEDCAVCAGTYHRYVAIDLLVES